MISTCFSMLEGEEKNKFERLFHTYYQSMLKVANLVTDSPAEAEEVVQEVFFKVAEVIDKFPEKACQREQSLLTVMTKNKAIDVVRRKKKYTELVSKEPSQEPFVNDLETEYIEREGEEMILALLSELPEKYRSVLLLHIADGWKLKDIAEFLDISVHLAEVRLNRGKKILQERILEEMKDRLPEHYKEKGRDNYEQSMGNGV